MALIASISGRVINESRGQTTVEVTIGDDKGKMATVSLPMGSSIGKYEATMVDAATAVATINSTLASALLRTPLDSQAELDNRLNAFDSSPNKEKLGVNSLLGISLAGARLIAQNQNIPLYHYIQTISGSPGFSLPTPMFNLINGGKHAENNLDFQEYMIIPTGLKAFHEKLSAGKKVFTALGKILADTGHSPEVGYEGGYAPNLSTNEEGLGMLVEAIKAAGYVPGDDIMLGLDVAASALPPTFAPTVENYVSLFENFPMLSIEDPFGEDDIESWSKLRTQIDQLSDEKHPHLLVGDDLFVGNKDRLSQGIQSLVANAILVKINQAATLTDTLEVIKIARDYNYIHILSHRSGETLDSFVSDLAVGTAAAFIKAGAANDQAPERMVKYERIVDIEERLTMHS